jgi:hypothetical protein
MAKLLKPAAEVMRADAGLHPDQTWRHVRKPGFHLATRPLLPQHDGADLIETYDVERVLADIDADEGPVRGSLEVPYPMPVRVWRRRTAVPSSMSSPCEPRS